MSSPKTPRVMTAVRLSEKARTWLDTVAGTTEAKRSVVIRAALIVAARHEAELVQTIKEQS